MATTRGSREPRWRAAYLVFKFPQRVFLCPFNELGGGVASRWGGRCLHWQLIAHPLSRGTNAHFWAEIIEPDGKLADHAKKFLSESKMNTPYNEVTWKPEKIEKTALTIGGKPITAYSATYKTKMLSTLSATALEVSGTFWMLDIEKSRVVLQEDNFKEKFDASDLMAKALSLSKTPQWGDIKIMQTTSTSYRYLNSDLARRLAAYIRSLGTVDPHTRLFDIGGDTKRAAWSSVPNVETLYRDLEAAGIPLKDARDRVADFHALRMTYITHLRMAGVDLDMAQRLARHSDRKLTEEIYTDHDLMPEREAAEMLVPERRRQKFVPRLR